MRYALTTHITEIEYYRWHYLNCLSRLMNIGEAQQIGIDYNKNTILSYDENDTHDDTYTSILKMSFEENKPVKLCKVQFSSLICEGLTQLKRENCQICFSSL